MTEQKPWRFYGREKELNGLTNGLEIGTPLAKRHFEAIKVRGRRGVGKTDLLNQMKDRAPPDMPVVSHQMDGPDPDEDKRPSLAEITGYVKETNRDLLAQSRTLGIGIPDACLPPHDDLHDERAWFKEVLTALVKAGAVVVLDEFHHAAPLGLHHKVKQVIDTAKGTSQANRKWPGKIVLMGSHQQKVDAMFAADQPLYGRIDATYALEPWRLTTIMTMAAEQGILASPAKFLTLWTAYDGIPCHWDRYCTTQNYDQLHGIDDERQWRLAWLAAEQNFLSGDERERWDAKAWIELKDEQREIMLWLGQNHPHRGATINEMPPTLRELPGRDAALRVLTEQLKLLRPTLPLLEKGRYRWVINDNNTLFQTHVFPELVRPIMAPRGLAKNTSDSIRREQLPTPEDLHARLTTLEGTALERLAATWLAERQGATWTDTGRERSRVEGDMDVMGATSGTPPRVWLGSAKRTADKHSPTEAREFMDRFLADLGTSAHDDAKWLLAGRVERLVFSTIFGPAQRDICAQEGFKPVDILDMARSFGLDPSPQLAATSPENEQEDEPDPAPEPPRPGL